jgi:protein-S-isoprenylcysteine O-methyltransferase Ste14
MNVMAAVGIGVCWGVVAVVWLATWGYNESRAPQVRQRSWYGTGVFPIVLITFIVRRAVPSADWASITFYTHWARFLGLAILVAAAALTLWARFVLGLMWNAAPSVKQGHQLRTRGPYSVTRHPIYTGLLGMMLGTLLLAGGNIWIVAFPIAVVLIECKIHIEERFMTGEFPEEYPRYRKRVPQLVPGLRLLAGRRAAA